MLPKFNFKFFNSKTFKYVWTVSPFQTVLEITNEQIGPHSLKFIVGGILSYFVLNSASKLLQKAVGTFYGSPKGPEDYTKDFFNLFHNKPRKFQKDLHKLFDLLYAKDENGVPLSPLRDEVREQLTIIHDFSELCMKQVNINLYNHVEGIHVYLHTFEHHGAGNFNYFIPKFNEKFMNLTLSLVDPNYTEASSETLAELERLFISAFSMGQVPFE